MKRKWIAIGPGAASLILIVVVLSISVLGILALISARSDCKLGERSIEMTEKIYELNEKAESSVMMLDRLLYECTAHSTDNEEYLHKIFVNLPKNMEMFDTYVSWQEKNDTHILYCTVLLNELGTDFRFEWKEYRLSMQMEDYEDIWN